MSPTPDWREQLARHRRNTPLVAAALGLVLLVLTGLYYLVQRGRNLPETLVTDQVLLFFLRNVNVLLILVITFVLARNLVKLWIERRRRDPGSKFRTKLVATYVGLSLVPVVLLAFYAVELLQSSVERWASPPLRALLEQASEVGKAANRLIEERTQRDAGEVAARFAEVDLGNAASRPRLEERLRAERARLGLDYLGLYADTEFVLGVLDPQRGLADLPEPGRAILREALEHGRALRIVESAGLGRGRLVLGLAAAAPQGERARALVVAGNLVDPALASPSSQLVESFQRYRQLEVQQGAFKASYLLTFLLVTLLILLASSWTGLYLARRITVPIQALAEGTRRVTTGDFEQPVEVPADDEVGALVDSFNRMTAELKRHRELIERSHRDLVDANRRLAEERARVSTVLENVAAGVLSVDREGRVQTCNGPALTMLRLRAENVLGRPANEALADAELAKLARLIELTPELGPAASFELRMVIGESWKTFEIKISRLRDASGKPTGKVVFIEDLTELIKAQKLAAWSEAARRVAHEIKNPLTPIRLAAERVLAKHRQGDADFAPVLEASAETIVREVARLQALVDEFSRFARMPAPQPVAVDLAALTEELLPLYRGLKPGLTVRAEIAAALAPIAADPEQLRRVLINLLDNAVEATEPPGEIVVAAREVGESIEIAVADSGRGVPPEARDKLFLPFFSTKGRGTGLGLAIVHRIVSDHHGSIRVEEREPHGSLFVVSLPRS